MSSGENYDSLMQKVSLTRCVHKAIAMVVCSVMSNYQLPKCLQVGTGGIAGRLAGKGLYSSAVIVHPSAIGEAFIQAINIPTLWLCAEGSLFPFVFMGRCLIILVWGYGFRGSGSELGKEQVSGECDFSKSDTYYI